MSDGLQFADRREGGRFLAERPYLSASDSQRTLATHRTLG